MVETLYDSVNGLYCRPSPTSDQETTSATTVYPVADSFIRGGADDSTNYGSDPQIRIKYSGADTMRVGYFKWQLPSDLTTDNLLSATASFVVEKFHTTGFDGELQARAAFPDWDEETITWSERVQNEQGVGFGDILCSWPPTGTATAQPVDLTEAARRSLNAGDSYVSVVVWSTKGADAQDIYLPSKEGSNGVPLFITKCDDGQCPDLAPLPTDPPIEPCNLITFLLQLLLGWLGFFFCDL